MATSYIYSQYIKFYTIQTRNNIQKFNRLYTLNAILYYHNTQIDD